MFEKPIKAEKLKKKREIKYKSIVNVDFTEIFNRAMLQPDSLTLDVATGVGTIPHLLGSQVVALDVSNKICHALWVCGDARTMPFRRDAFNLVTSFAGLMFIKGRRNKAKVLTECLRVLKTEGKLVLVEPNIHKAHSDSPIRFDVWWKGSRIVEIGVGTTGEGLEQSAKLVKEMVQNLGFSIITEDSSLKYFRLICQK